MVGESTAGSGKVGSGEPVRVPRPAVERSLHAWLDGAAPVLVVRGRRGTGTTTALGGLADEIRGRESTDLVVVAAPVDVQTWIDGGTGALCSAGDLVQGVVERFQEELDSTALHRLFGTPVAPGPPSPAAGPDAIVTLAQHFATLRFDLDRSLADLGRVLQSLGDGPTLVVIVDGLARLTAPAGTGDLAAAVVRLAALARTAPRLRVVIGTEPDTSVMRSLAVMAGAGAETVDLDALADAVEERAALLDAATALTGDAARAASVVAGADRRWSVVVAACRHAPPVDGKAVGPRLRELLETHAESIRADRDFAAVVRPAVVALACSEDEGIPLVTLAAVLGTSATDAMEVTRRTLGRWLTRDVDHERPLALLREVKEWVCGPDDPFDLVPFEVHERLARALDADARWGDVRACRYAIRHVAHHWMEAAARARGAAVHDLRMRAKAVLEDRSWQERLVVLEGVTAARVRWSAACEKLARSMGWQPHLLRWHAIEHLGDLSGSGAPSGSALVLPGEDPLPRARSGAGIPDRIEALALGLTMSRTETADGSTRVEVMGDLRWTGRTAMVTLRAPQRPSVTLLVPFPGRDLSPVTAFTVSDVAATDLEVVVAPVPLTDDLLVDMPDEVLRRSMDLDVADGTAQRWQDLLRGTDLLDPGPGRG